ncbi:lymphocyte function-associated antigen 3 isoform X1 [Struthio camelus]|uniref:lymphocyte function-associated antigen 3 isoform X1 n=1 Tax=Struthio camelus TaxID=8801 RepID=UPI003603D30F
MRLLASPGELLLLLLGCLLVHIRCEEVFGILGENFTFPVKIDKKLMEITWKKNKDKVAESDQGQTEYFPSFQNRVLLNEETGSLTIFNLEKKDAATYALEYLPSDEKTLILTFILTVLDPPSAPTISCNISGDDLVLKCGTDFKEPLTYSWKFSSIADYKQHQDVVILNKWKVDASEKVACFIKVSQTEKSSEFSLAECFPGDTYHKRRRDGLIVAFVVLPIAVAVISVFLYKRVRCGSKRGRCKNSHQTNGSGEEMKILNQESQDQSISDVCTAQKSSPSARPAAEHGVNESGASQVAGDGSGQRLSGSRSPSEGDVCTAQKSSPSARPAAEHGVNESGASQVAGDGSGQRLSGSRSPSEGDLKS